MGVLSEYFPQQGSQPSTLANGYYRTFTEPAPSFSAWGGSLYDHPMTRAAVERFAAACSKAKPEFLGSKWCKPLVRKLFETWPNDLMTWPAFLAKAATIYEMDTTVFIVPGLDRNLNTVALFPLKPSHTDVVDYAGEPWFVFHLYTGEVMAIEVSRVAVVSKFQYLSDFFGEGNDVMDPTLGLMDAQRQAEMQAIQNGARIRFIGRVAGMTHGDDLKRKREQFYIDNLSQQNRTGLMLYDNTFQEVKQIDEQRFIIDEDEMERVTKPIFYYFGINEDILTNSYDEDSWGRGTRAGSNSSSLPSPRPSPSRCSACRRYSAATASCSPAAASSMPATTPSSKSSTSSAAGDTSPSTRAAPSCSSRRYLAARHARCAASTTSSTRRTTSSQSPVVTAAAETAAGMTAGTITTA